MLMWAFIFLVVALIAGALGLRKTEHVAAGISKFFFFLFLIVFVVLLLLGLFATTPTTA